MHSVILVQVVHRARKIVGWDVNVTWGSNSRPLEPNYLDIDGAKFHRRTDWKARFTLESGLAKTIDYWRQNLEAPKRAIIE